MDKTNALQNLLNGTASEEEINMLKGGLVSGEISIGGNVNQSVIIIGSGNTVELPPAALDRLGGRSLLGDLDRNLTGDEIAVGLNRLEAELPHRAPVLLTQFQEQTRRLRPSLKTNPNSLSDHARGARVEALAQVNSLCMESLDISFNALCLGEEPPEYDSRSPFRGLESFRPEDSEFFFGRESLTKKLVAKVQSYPFLAVLGASGSGKSSLVMAGLVSALCLEYAIFRPGVNPLGELETAREKQLIVVDQFEELFTLTRDESIRMEFIKSLLELLKTNRVIVTMRADFWGEVAIYKDLKQVMQDHQELIAPMDMDELGLAMEGQAGRAGLYFEADLSHQILDDVEGEPGAMPLLQHALWELWNRRHGCWLRASEYRAFGGVKQAITSTAEKVFGECTRAEQEQIQDIFLRLTRLDDSDEGRDTRRRVALNNLFPSKHDTISITLLLNKLANARLIVKTVREEKTEIEVAHEALIRHWVRLQNWLKEDRGQLRLRNEVIDAATKWASNERDESLLIHLGARLESALEIKEKLAHLFNAIEINYLEFCLQKQKEEDRLKLRNTYLATSTEIVKIITSTLDLSSIFARTVNLIIEHFNYYHVGIFIVEETGFNAILREATGEAGRVMKEGKHTLQVNERTIVGKATFYGKPMIVNDVTVDSLHRFNPLLPETCAEAVIPLTIGNRVIGAIDIQAKTVGAFAEDEISILQALADQVAVAVDNARTYEVSIGAVKDTQKELRDAHEEKNQFFIAAFQELKEKVGSLGDFVQVVLVGADSSTAESYKPNLYKIYSTTQYLLELLGNADDISSIKSGEIKLMLSEDTDIKELVDSAIDTAYKFFGDKSIIVEKNFPVDMPYVNADPSRIHQVISRLLLNIFMCTTESTVTIEAHIHYSINTTAKPPFLIVSITDTDSNITNAEWEELLEQHVEPHDLSFSISFCQLIIRKHDGRIGVTNKNGKGNRSYFALPLPLNFGKKVILSIDDDTQVISLYERYLDSQGYQIVALTNPAMAVEQAKQIQPFAITLDILMPDIDGWQVLDKLKSDPDTRNIPVIICSIIEDSDRGYKLGATDYLVKPILEEDFVNALDRLKSDGSIYDILVIDDNEHDLRLIGKLLTDDGRYKAILANGGPIGWEIISSGKLPHVVILDIFMPEMDGFKILENMQASERLRDVPVVVISDMDMTTEQNNQLNKLGQRMLLKGSFTKNELFTSIQRALERVHLH